MLARYTLYIALLLTLISWLPLPFQEDLKFSAIVTLLMAVFFALYHVVSYGIAITLNHIARKHGKANFFIVQNYDNITTEKNLRGVVVYWIYNPILWLIIGLIMWKLFFPLFKIADKIVNLF